MTKEKKMTRIYDPRKKTFHPRKRSATDLEKDIEIYRTELRYRDKTRNGNLRACEEMKGE